MTKKRLGFGAVAVSIVLLIPLAANSCAAARDSAEVATDQFRMRLGRAAYGEIVQSAAPEFRRATTEQEFGKAMDGVKEQLGVWQWSEAPAWRVLAGWTMRTVTLVYTSHFERGTATEEFVWRVEKGVPALAGYHVKSAAVAH
jgi:hypothetical protein